MDMMKYLVAACVLLLTIDTGRATTYDINATGTLGGTISGFFVLDPSGQITSENLSVVEPSIPSHSYVDIPSAYTFSSAFGAARAYWEFNFDTPFPSHDLNLIILNPSPSSSTWTDASSLTLVFGTSPGSFYNVFSTGVDYLSSGTITQELSATPVPAALPLFLSGIGGLGLLARRRKRRRAPAIAAA